MIWGGLIRPRDEGYCDFSWAKFVGFLYVENGLYVIIPNNLHPNYWTTKGDPLRDCFHHALLIASSLKWKTIISTSFFNSQNTLFIDCVLRKNPNNKVPFQWLWIFSPWRKQHLQKKITFTCSQILWYFTINPINPERKILRNLTFINSFPNTSTSYNLVLEKPSLALNS